MPCRKEVEVPVIKHVDAEEVLRPFEIVQTYQPGLELSTCSNTNHVSNTDAHDAEIPYSSTMAMTSSSNPSNCA